MKTRTVGARAQVRALTVVAVLGSSLSAWSAPRVPPGDDIVLERVPEAAMMARLAPLRVRLREQPDDRSTALTLARDYIQIGRASADPRFISYAQATLEPWLARTRANAETLVLAATALQYLHRFDDALALLDRALALAPADAQALLTKATLLQVQGRFEAARRACRPLIRAAGQLIAVACLTSVDSRTGQLARSYDGLNAVFTDDPRLPGELRAWLLGAQAEMAVRRGDLDTAETHYKAALNVAPDDLYLKADYADLLLLQRRDASVVSLLKINEAQDVLLLRLAIAGRRVGAPEGERWSKTFRERFEAARRDGDFTHLREQARYFLDVAHEPKRAVALARENWAVQREPADVRIYLQAATQAQSSADLQTIRDWIERTRYEDHTLEAARDSPPEVTRR